MELDDDAKRAVLEAPQEVQRRILAEVPAGVEAGRGLEEIRPKSGNTCYLLVNRHITMEHHIFLIDG